MIPLHFTKEQAERTLSRYWGEDWLALHAEIARLRRVEAAAIRWWESKRPVGTSVETHRLNPCVNCMTQWESCLARAIVRGEEEPQP